MRAAGHFDSVSIVNGSLLTQLCETTVNIAYHFVIWKSHVYGFLFHQGEQKSFFNPPLFIFSAQPVLFINSCCKHLSIFPSLRDFEGLCHFKDAQIVKLLPQKLT